MKLILNLVLIAFFSYYLEKWFPWWIIAPIGASVCFFNVVGAFSAFVSGFLGGGGLWLWMAWYMHAQSPLCARIAPLIGLNNPMHLVLLTALIGGFVTGLGAISGHCIRDLFRSRSQSDKGYFQ